MPTSIEPSPSSARRRTGPFSPPPSKRMPRVVAPVAIQLLTAFTVGALAVVVAIRLDDAAILVTGLGIATVMIGLAWWATRAALKGRGPRPAAIEHQTERIRLIRQVGELSAVLEAGRRLESVDLLEDLYMALATEAEALAAADAALVVLRSPDGLMIAAATESADRKDPQLDAQCQNWNGFLDDGGLPMLAAGQGAIVDHCGHGPLGDRYGAVLEVPLVANGHPIGLVFVMRRIAAATPFDAEALQAVGLLAGIASHMVLLRSSNQAIRAKNKKLRRSILERDRAEAKLIQTQKQRAVGELVSGVAHELNNPLTALLGFAQVLTLSDAVQREPEKSWVNDILREGQRCSVIIQNLLGFARRSAGPRGSSSVSCVIAETLSLKTYDLRAADIEVEMVVPEELPTPEIDRQRLQLVLLNLLNNAIAAMKAAEIRKLTVAARMEDDQVVIDVVDTGCGMTAEVREHLFEPFFTTKPPLEGIGIGLRTCRKELDASGGTISVESIPGRGSTFTVRLPIPAAEAAACA